MSHRSRHLVERTAETVDCVCLVYNLAVQHSAEREVNHLLFIVRSVAVAVYVSIVNYGSSGCYMCVGIEFLEQVCRYNRVGRCFSGLLAYYLVATDSCFVRRRYAGELVRLGDCYNAACLHAVGLLYYVEVFRRLYQPSILAVHTLGSVVGLIGHAIVEPCGVLVEVASALQTETNLTRAERYDVD